MPVSAYVDSHDAPASLLVFLGGIEPRARERGRNCEFDGHVVKLLRRNAATVSANVLTRERIYAAEITRSARGWTSVCTCGLRDASCEHAAALAFAWLNRIRAGSTLEPGAGPPGRPVFSKEAGPGPFPTPAAPKSPSATKLTFRQQWEPILAAKLGRPLTHSEGAFLGKLAQFFQAFRMAGRVSPEEIGRLGFATNEAKRQAYYDTYQGWWEVPPRDPLELWQIVAHDIETSGLVVPDFIRPITDTAPVRARFEKRARQKAVLQWNDRFDRVIVAAGQRARSEVAPPPEWLDLRLCVGIDKWILETRAAPDAPWKTAPHALFDRFTHQRPGDLALIQSSPAVFAFLALGQEHYRSHYGFRLTAGGHGGSEFLHRLLSHPLARTLVTTATGAPFTFAPEPLRWELARSAADVRDYELTLRLPDGKALPPSILHLPGQPNYYLLDSVIYRGPPAIDGVGAAVATSALVPAEVIEKPEVLRTLRRFDTRLPAALEERFVHLVMRARVRCTLEFDHADTELFLLELLAFSEKPRVQQIWEPRGWVQFRDAQGNDSPGDGKIFTYDFAAPDEVVARLPALNVEYDPYEECWRRRLTKSFPEEFVAWREALPPGVEVIASGELASLLGAPVKARIDFNLIASNVHRDWFDLALALKPEDTTLTPEEIALLLKARGKLVRLPGKGWRRLTVELEGAPTAALEAAGFDTASIAEAALAGEKHRFHALQLAHTAVADLLPVQQAEALRARAHAIALPAPPALPAGLRAELRPYQLEGFHFLAFLSANQLGGVLADDMGLGKTVQTLAWLLWLAEKQPVDEPLRALVVCPKSVVGIWEVETAKFAPSIKTIRFTPKLADASSPVSAPEPRLVIANYAQLRLAADYFSAQRWHAVILDEGQFIKTPTSKVAQVAREVPGEHRLILTGTPIENRLLDLWSLFAFSLPGLLGTQAAFKRHYADDNPLALMRLRTRVRHFLLRRTKAQVAADLPARTEEDVLVELEGEQRQLYDAELKRARAELLKVETAREFDQMRFNVLASLLRLRQICCHPALIDSAHREAPSAKLEELMERLEELRAEGNQVLVFSQFVTMLELIREKLVAAGIGHLILTGQTENRDELVQQFQTEKKHTVFLLSLKAAGFGLNLTAASYVILYDPWWNPAVEAQAIDRTHRIGQLLPVNAYRFIARGTIEEKIRVLQKEKSALASAIVQEESLASVLDLDSLRQILA
ncbi:MAG: DEAD/DEAH box helicase [Opitutus sp.]|nr:DEAD/DEAH box helicase [Opitutus sp.]